MVYEFVRTKSCMHELYENKQGSKHSFLIQFMNQLKAWTKLHSNSIMIVCKEYFIQTKEYFWTRHHYSIEYLSQIEFIKYKLYREVVWSNFHSLYVIECRFTYAKNKIIRQSTQTTFKAIEFNIQTLWICVLNLSESVWNSNIMFLDVAMPHIWTNTTGYQGFKSTEWNQ